MRPKGPIASRARQRKFGLLRSLRLPEGALPGSLALTHTRCGKPSCHCRKGGGHPRWLLTFMDSGRKRVEWIPREWAEEVQRAVEAGRTFKEAWSEVLLANVELLLERRRQRRR